MSPVRRFTQNNLYITDVQRQFYEDNGYLLIRNLVNHELLDECRNRFVDICNGKVDNGNNGNMIVMKDMSLMKTDAKGEFLINKIQEFLYDDILFNYASDKAITNIVSSIIGNDVTAVHSMLINKPPNALNATSTHPIHQDLHYFPIRPADKICAAWTAMETIDERNGCLYVIPGTHKGILYHHVYPDGIKNKGYHGIPGFENIPRTNLVMEKGDTVFFHPTLLHGSGPNYTKGFRKAISVHYANGHCYFIDLKGTSQEKIADEIVKLAKKKGWNVTYEDFWKYKSRTITGYPGHFHYLSSHL